jgi:demethylmenaquinone methyltransferase/2-methoxy-6-polyprenyl-1,4-benzoquinol methylase
MESLASKIPKTYAEKLYYSNILREQMIRSAISKLQLPSGSRGLDVGCGIGTPALWLAEAVVPDGAVTGVDIAKEFLDQARELVKKSPFPKQIAFQEGNMNKLPFDDKTFDWAWSLDCIRSQQPVKELVRVVKPGGIAAILFWSSQQLLPGYPLLEARLNATSAGTAPFDRGMKPESHFLRMLGWLRDAGMKDCHAITFIDDVNAPLNEATVLSMLSLFEMRWEDSLSELNAEELTEYQRLCNPDSPDLILNSPDYYAFFTYSMFYGKVV